MREVERKLADHAARRGRRLAPQAPPHRDRARAQRARRLPPRPRGARRRADADDRDERRPRRGERRGLPRRDRVELRVHDAAPHRRGGGADDLPRRLERPRPGGRDARRRRRRRLDRARARRARRRRVPHEPRPRLRAPDRAVHPPRPADGGGHDGLPQRHARAPRRARARRGPPHRRHRRRGNGHHAGRDRARPRGGGSGAHPRTQADRGARGGRPRRALAPERLRAGRDPGDHAGARARLRRRRRRGRRDDALLRPGRARDLASATSCTAPRWPRPSCPSPKRATHPPARTPAARGRRLSKRGRPRPRGSSG